MRKQTGSVDDYDTLYKERQYDFTWYSGLWRVLRPILVFACAAAIVAGLCVMAWNSIDAHFLQPVDAGDTEEVAFAVESGNSLSRVAANLEAQGLIHSHTFFKYYCDFAGLGQKIQTGQYMISRSMTMMEIADLLTTGDGTPLVTTITIIPGDSVEDIAAMLKSKGILTDTASFLSICKTGAGVTDYWFVDELLQGKNVSQKKYLLEGYLAANTYEVYTSATSLDIIRKLLSQTDKLYTAEDQDRATELGMTMDEVLTLASLIEKESGTEDFDKVSAVFHNRLKSGMKLQSDPTIHYITGEKRMSLRESDLAVSSPYNTYTSKGLPPGAICSPSPDAIKAALYPSEEYVSGKYLYFCAMEPGSGKLYFSKTLEEHEQMVAIYSPLWKAYDEERGL